MINFYIEKSNMTNIKSFVFDTSFLISLLYESDINHQTAYEKIEKLEIGENKFFVSELIYIEAITVINYKMWYTWVEKIDSFFEWIQIEFISSQLSEYIRFFKNLKSNLSIADISVVYDSMKYNFELLNFDKWINKTLREIKKNK